MSRSNNYSNLRKYSSGLTGVDVMQVPKGITTEVPVSVAPGYSSLLGKNLGNGSGFATISQAYSIGKNCNQNYIKNFCSN